MQAKRFDIHKVLKVFGTIVQKGTKDNGTYEYMGIQASSADDGYTVQLTDGQVTLHVYFHNTYDVDFETEHQLEQFQIKLHEIEAGEKGKPREAS